jgi:Rrf2 family protein
MQITREADYAIRCVLYLSQYYGEVKVVDEIARAKSIPRVFLSKILQKLSRAGIVRSHRGVKGGFELAKRPGDISLLDVIEAIDGPVAMNRCAIDRRLCSLSDECVVHPVWVELRKEIERRLRKIDFGRLVALQARVVKG